MALSYQTEFGHIQFMCMLPVWYNSIKNKLYAHVVRVCALGAVLLYVSLWGQRVLWTGLRT